MEISQRFVGGFGRRLVGLRERRDWRQADLARVAHLPQWRLSRLERDLAEPRMSEVVSLCQALGTSADFLLFGKNEEPKEEVHEAMTLYRLTTRIAQALARESSLTWIQGFLARMAARAEDGPR